MYYIIQSPYHRRKDLLRRQEGMDDMKEFIAFSRKLLRSLKKLKELIEADKKDEALEMLNELIEDTQKDIEA